MFPNFDTLRVMLIAGASAILLVVGRLLILAIQRNPLNF